MEQFDEKHHALVTEALEEREHLRDLLTSVRAICARQGMDTNWEALDRRIESFGVGPVTPSTFRLITTPPLGCIPALRTRIAELEAEKAKSSELWLAQTAALGAATTRISAMEAGIREYLKSEFDGVEDHCGDPNCDICQSLSGLRRLLDGRGEKCI